ncbi:3-dehydroquinate synthase [Helicobacter marmotae]|uniref:3-dehydroquinate synthase n=1 Tax=Helicobacter marmotae TaxID=152490 RepID=A0A3D8I7G1_9HELI|nr:3-dehydroquinate synthase [Helicobacter marmotae]RDU61089.1 3-dehydroquinate synthase [Helicobacter marmotae]
MTIEIQTQSAQYPIHIGAIPTLESPHKVLIVSNPKVAGLYLERVLAHIRAKEVYVCIIPDGEQYKNMQSIEHILECAFCHHLDRKSLMIALGGGVIGDMVGFASGIYQRGIDFIQIPTTLLAQVDASVGGKCGINNAFGKNLVGLFHQPKAVYIDPSMLATLPPREFGAGMAEMIKMAVCFDRAFFEELLKAPLRLEDSDTLSAAIARSVKIKAEVVNADEKEQGIRAALNYGHTFAHVIENLTQYKEFLHGEAVSIGMCMANALSYELGMLSLDECQSIEHTLKAYNLPTHYAFKNPQHFYEKFYLDKKSTDSKIMFVLPNGIGGVKLCSDIPKERVLKVLASMGGKNED